MNTELILFFLKTIPVVWFTTGVGFTCLIILEITTLIRKNREVNRLKKVINDMQMFMDVPVKEARKILNGIERSNHNE